ncbi:MAG TPA: diacylglycerol kinase [Aeromonadales bacterium]|nr:diacylglycerol kinase [Aeromonadales bacterium]
MKPGLKGFARWFPAFQNSMNGFKAAYKYEAAFREETLLALISLPLAIYFGESAIEIILLWGSVLSLLIVELLNSAVETVVDRVGEEYHELSGRAKDIASAAVLLAIFVIIFTWAMILIPKYL